MTSYCSLWVQHSAAFGSIEQCVSKLNPNFLTMVTSAGSSVSVWEKWLTQLKLLLLQWWHNDQHYRCLHWSRCRLGLELRIDDLLRLPQEYRGHHHVMVVITAPDVSSRHTHVTGTEVMTLSFTEQPLMTLNFQLEAFRGKTGWVLSALKMLVFCRK